VGGGVQDTHRCDGGSSVLGSGTGQSREEEEEDGGNDDDDDDDDEIFSLRVVTGDCCEPSSFIGLLFP
jgi:hypothetical protein